MVFDPVKKSNKKLLQQLSMVFDPVKKSSEKLLQQLSMVFDPVKKSSENAYISLKTYSKHQVT